MRKLYYILFSLLFFALGFGMRHIITFPPNCDHHIKHAISLQEALHGDSTIYTPTRYSTLSDRYKGYLPSSDSSELRVFFDNGMTGRLFGVILSGQGNVYKIEKQGESRSDIKAHDRQLVHKLSQEQTNSIFFDIINSGILNFDKAVIDLKKDLILGKIPAMISDASVTFIEINAPSLEVEKTISTYALDHVMSHNPHIKEYQILSKVRDQLVDLLPE